jgi:S-adenosylmethionine:diacylglycerol 3-amino-3-carboxypropyl transferase
MASVRSVLVVGGGTAGCTLAALLGRAGVSVEIVERNPNFTALGSGITLQGPALRVLQQVGVLDDLRRYGWEFGSVGLRSADGRLLAENPTPPTMGAYRPKLAELLAAAAVDAGAKVRLGATVESLSQDGRLSAVQRGFHEKLGAQCGYCTPGFIMASAGLLRRNPRPSEADIVAALSSNICRCTGYVKIIEAVKYAAELHAQGTAP